MKYVIFIVFVFVSLESWAQKTFSITIDSDDDQFFSVAIGKKNYPSSSIGHLAIPGFKDSVYKLTVSFPRSTFGPEIFTIDIENRDHVLQLKKNADKTWSLFDVATRVTISSGNTIVAASFSNEADARKTRQAFAQLMAAVVNDTSVLNAPVEYLAESPKPQTVNSKQQTAANKPLLSSDKPDKPKEPIDSPVVKVQKDSPAAKLDSSARITVKNDSIVKNHKATVITRIEEQLTDSSRKIVYVDKDADHQKADTIQVLIPLDSVAPPPAQDSPDIKTRTPEIITGSVKIKPEEKPVADSITVQHTPDTSVAKPGKELVIPPSDTLSGKPAPSDSTRKLQLVNSDCRNFATEADVDKLRVKMLSENNLEERVLVAKKFFKTRCFTTRQIRALTELFPSDKTRYEFFDAAYPFVSDSYNFKELAELLTDEYYLGRFRAMVRM